MKHDRIHVDPDVMFGKPVIKGTRITVEHILRKLSAGQSADEILADHPHLTREDVLAAAGYPADHMAREETAFESAPSSDFPTNIRDAGSNEGSD
ncbi:MAG: DUF433 domain-containing protein [Bacteroidetes bacterium]|jgi:uncharacterized protein (DUF433 family)|nr:DUF433 domain-containing protein [Bacteroidota bacterium]